MNLAPRERRTVLIGAILAGLALLYMGGKQVAKAMSSGRGASLDHKRSQFLDASARIKRYAIATREMKQQIETLKVEVPGDPPEDQMKKLVERFEQLAGRSNVQIRNITQLKSQARSTARGPSPRTELKLDLTAPSYAQLVKFVDSLEQATVPIVVDQISITAMGGRTGAGGASPRSSRGGEPQKRQLQAALKIYTYLFPEKAQQ